MRPQGADESLPRVDLSWVLDSSFFEFKGGKVDIDRTLGKDSGLNIGNNFTEDRVLSMLSPFIDNDGMYLREWKRIFPRSLWKESHEKVIEMNPEWMGEGERIIDYVLEQSNLVQARRKFRDLAAVSKFSKSKKQLRLLMDEIKKDVFGNIGEIKTVSLRDELEIGFYGEEFKFALMSEHLLDNIVFFAKPSQYRKKGYIGLVENGPLEIRIIVGRDKFIFWDTDINKIIDSLRDAIMWWNTKAQFTAKEKERHENYNDYDDDYSDPHHPSRGMWIDDENWFSYTDD